MYIKTFYWKVFRLKSCALYIYFRSRALFSNHWLPRYNTSINWWKLTIGIILIY